MSGQRRGSGSGSGKELGMSVVASDVEREFMKRQLNHTVTATDNNGTKQQSLANATLQLSQQHLSQQQLSRQQQQQQQQQQQLQLPQQITAGDVFSELTNVLQDRLVVLEKQVRLPAHPSIYPNAY